MQVVSATTDSEADALRAGAVQFLTKPVKREVLLDAVNNAIKSR